MNIRIAAPKDRNASAPADAPCAVPGDIAQATPASIVPRRHSSVARFFRKARESAEMRATSTQAHAQAVTELIDAASDSSPPSATKRALQAAENEGWK
jgi:hypothetical protein